MGTTTRATQPGESGLQRIDYLLECFKLAKEELLLRFKYREHWLQLQLLAQAALVALSLGIEVAGVKGPATPNVIILSPAISAIFACLYFVDDSLITYIGGYVAALTNAEAELRSCSLRILNWDSSSQVKEYVKQALIAKYVAQFIAFAVLPLGLFVWRASTFATWGPVRFAESAWNAVFLAIIGIVFGKSLQRRRNAYLVAGRTILADTSSSRTEP